MSSINDLASEIANELHRYTNLIIEEVEEAKIEVANDLVTKLELTSPKRTGKYRKGWRAKKVGNKIIVHNMSHYRLTHLLENGHVKAGGGRVVARVHIRPAEQIAIIDYLERVERAIRT